MSAPRPLAPRPLARRSLLIGLLLAPLAACGVKGSPQPPEGEEQRYRQRDRRYPAPHTVVPDGAAGTGDAQE